MKKLNLRAMLAGIIFTSGCATETIIFRKGDLVAGYQLSTVYSGKINDKPYREVEFKDDQYHHFPAKMNDDGTGEITLGTGPNSTSLYFRVHEDSNPDNRGIILINPETKR
jgi:hypothetical protein